MFDETNTLVTATCIVNLHYNFIILACTMGLYAIYCSNMQLTKKGFINILTIIVKTFATDSCIRYIIM